MSIETKLAELIQSSDNLANSITQQLQNVNQKADTKETPSGAQAKADQAESNAKDYTDQLQSNLVEKSPSILVVDQLRRSVEAASGGRVTVFYTAKGQPSYFHVLPKFLCEDIAPGGELGTGVFPAFLNDGVEEDQIYIGQFQMSEIAGEGVSQPQREVRRSIDWDASRSLIQACGPGFDMMTIWDWAALHFWTQRTGFEPRGNTDRGRHHDERHETAIRVDGGLPGSSDGSTSGNTLSGSGPMTWRHDGTPAGVADTVGNVWEWLLGMKLMDGRVMLAADNGIGSESSWQDTGYDMPNLSSSTFDNLDNSGAPEAVLRALLMPTGAHPMTGSAWTNLDGERFPGRGGARNGGGLAGPAALSLATARTDSIANTGSRPRFRPQ